MKVRVFGKRENKRENKLEVLCIVTINVLENMNAKEETDFKGLRGKLVCRDGISVKYRLFSYITLF